MYRKVSTDMNFVEREKSVLEFWKQNNIIKKSFHHRDGAERFTFFDGPPTATAVPTSAILKPALSRTSFRASSP